MDLELLSNLLAEINRMNTTVNESTNESARRNQQLERDKALLVETMNVTIDILLEQAATLKFKAERMLARTHNGNPRIYHCYLCGFKLALPDAIQIHLERCHNIPYGMALCGAILSCDDTKPRFPPVLLDEITNRPLNSEFKILPLMYCFGKDLRDLIRPAAPVGLAGPIGPTTIVTSTRAPATVPTRNFVNIPATLSRHGIDLARVHRALSELDPGWNTRNTGQRNAGQRRNGQNGQNGTQTPYRARGRFGGL
jgi:hypothetical protein